MNAAEVHAGCLQVAAAAIERAREFGHLRAVGDAELETAALEIVHALLGERRMPAALDALVDLLDRRGELKEHNDRLLAEAAAELRADREVEHANAAGAAQRWLRRQLAGGEWPVKELQTQAADDGLRWATVEDVKADAGVGQRWRGRTSCWSLATPATPAVNAEPAGTLVDVSRSDAA